VTNRAGCAKMPPEEMENSPMAAEFDLVVRGGTVVDGTGRAPIEADVGIKDGRIAALAAELTEADEVIDATGLFVLPGGIDSHVHLDQPSGDGIVMADDFDSGTRSAAIGGNSTVLAFCMQEKGQRFSDPDDAKRSVSSLLDAQVARGGTDPGGKDAKQELVVASADATCAKDTVWPVQEQLELAVVRQEGVSLGEVMEQYVWQDRQDNAGRLRERDRDSALFHRVPTGRAGIPQ
jgi:cytosine/adenosine deaminase-related metal-dependent hydrolase